MFIVRKILYANIVRNFIFKINNILDYEKAQNDKILKDLVNLFKEMNSKYNSYDNFDKIKCIEDPKILDLEKKFDSFSIDNNYDYAINILKSKNSLPNINIDLSKIVAFYKQKNVTLEELIKEVVSFNEFFTATTKNLTLNKLKTIKEKSIIYYLFYYMSRAVFYIISNGNFMVSKENCLIFQLFFSNYLNIIKAARLYLREDILKSSMIIEEGEKKSIKKEINQGVYEAFEELKKYPNEFKDAILNCQNFIILILLSSEPKKDNLFLFPRQNVMDPDLLSLLEVIVKTLDVFYKVNLKYSIIDYKNFYNDGMSKNLNLKNEFKNYLNNKKIRKEMKKEKEKAKAKKKDENNKDKEKKEKNDDILDFEDEKSDEEEIDNEKNKYKLTFSSLSYMWIFNPAAKNNIIFLFNKLQKDSEIRKSIRENGIQFLGLPIIPTKDILLTIIIRRQNLIEDTLNELSKPGVKLQNPIRVKFIGEQGVDEGGVRKEFFLLLIRQIFDPDYGMFNYNKKTRLYWFNHYSFEPKIKYEL